MSKRALMGMTAVAIALFAFIVLYEKDTLTSVELQTRENKLIERLVRSRLSKIAITRAGAEPIVLERAKDTDEDAETDIVESEWEAWQVKTPDLGEADQEAIGSLLGALEWADSRRELVDISAEDREQFGLNAPRVQADLTVANEVLTLRFGGDATGGGVYLAIGDQPNAFVVGRDVFEAVDHAAGHFRNKEIFSRSTLAISAIRYGSVAATRVDDRWLLTAPVAMRAADGRVEESIRALAQVKARSFVSDEPTDLSAYGLDAPTITISGELADGPFTMNVGADCDEEGQVHVRVDDGPVVCALRSDVAPFIRDTDDHRELRVVTTQDDELAELSITTQAGARLALTEEEGALTYEFTDGATVSSGPVNRDALAEWLRDLRRTRATEVVPREGPSAVAFGDASATLAIKPRNQERSAEVVELGSVDGENVFLRRAGESVVLVAPAALRALFTADVTRLRGRTLVQEELERVARVQLERNGVTEVLERRARGFAITAPVAQNADLTLARDLASRLAELRVTRFAPGEAIGDIRARVVIDYRAPEAGGHDHDHDHDHGEEDAPRPDAQRTLIVYGETSGGAFAKLDDDPTPFVIPDAFARLLLAPLARRDVLATSTDYIEKIEIVADAQTVTLLHDGADFRTLSGEQPDEERTRSLTERLADLRAAGATRYGDPPASFGLNPPRARIVITRHEDMSPRVVTIQIGAPVSDAPNAQVHVRRADLDLGYLLEADQVEALLRYEP